MPSRKRKKIRTVQKLASALADMLPADVRNDLRARKVPAETVVRMFTPDHNVLHAHGGSDLWWNLTMRLRGPELKAKDNRDTSIAAKTDRVGKDWRSFTRALSTGRKPRRRKSKWPTGRKIATRRKPWRR